MGTRHRYMPMDKRIARLAEILDVQGNDPKTYSDPYMIGLYNGMELSLALIEDRDACFRDVPKSKGFVNLVKRILKKGE